MQEYERGANRIGASRLSQPSQLLEIPIAFFFEGVPGGPANRGRRGREAQGELFERYRSAKEETPKPVLAYC